MSMKFLTGLQDLLGLYEPGSTASSPASPIPPTSPAMFAVSAQSHSAATSVRKKVSDANKESPDESARIRHCTHNRSVRFPQDEMVVTGFHEAPTSNFHSGNLDETVNTAEIIEAYRDTCRNRGCPPSPSVEKQISYFHKCPNTRQEILSLKGERVTHEQMEALEEIFKRVQFNTIDFEYTFLDDDCAISLGEMIEYYDSCVRLNLSFNKQIDFRGWTAIFKSMKNCHSLQMLNLRYTTLNDRTLPALCRTVRAVPPASLTCLHLENTQMCGKNLLVLICALKNNTGIKELYLGDNGLQGTDGSHIYQLITSNTSIQLLDLRNNNLSDPGVRHISDALKNRDALEKSSLTAIVLWNNHVTSASMDCLAEALKENTKIETLNVGNNKLGVDGIAKLKPAIISNTHLHRLGLQNTHIDCEGAIILAECIADNEALLRVDIRDNPIALAGVLALHSAMKLNKSITLLNIDANCVKLNSDKVREYQDEFEKYFNEIQTYCERNKDEVMRKLTVTFDDEEEMAKKVEEEKKKENEQNDEMVEKKETEEGGEDKDASTSSTQPSDSSNQPSSKEKENNNNDKKMLSRSHITKKERHQRFVRSSSLTCTETVHDLHDRLREMSGSTHSLDAASITISSSSPSTSMPLDSSSNAQSMKTIKKSFTVSDAPPSPLPLAEWGSLPAIPQASPTSTPVVRKFRRFSVSPSSSVFDVGSPTQSMSISKSETIPETVASAPTTPMIHPIRPSSLAIGIPLSGSVPSGPSSAPVLISECGEFWAPYKKDDKGAQSDTKQGSEEKKKSNYDLETDEQINESCMFVVNDLLNYIEYEENSKVERKASLLLKSAFVKPNIDELMRNLSSLNTGTTSIKTSDSTTSLRTPLTPSRVIGIAEELEGETDEEVCKSVLRCLIRDVLQSEKNELRSTLDRRRRHASVRNSPV